MNLEERSLSTQIIRFPQQQKTHQPAWVRDFRGSITSIKELKLRFGIDIEPLKKVSAYFPLRIPQYYLELVKEPFDPVWLQSIPDERELNEDGLPQDPLGEEKTSPVPGLSHRYPDRVLLMVTSSCAMYCRFCTRRRKVGKHFVVTHETIRAGIDYIAEHHEIRDVIISGGDPLTLHNKQLELILSSLRRIRHVEILRIGTRIPCVLPSRITHSLCKMLKKYHPLYINVHFNHPRELTPASQHALKMLSDAGIPLGSQTVLLKGVNDNPAVMKKLMQELLKTRVRPYYIFQADLSHGTEHFRTPVEKGIEIISALRGHTSGLAVPHYVIDMPDGGGKVPLIPDYLVSINKKKVTMRNYKGCLYTYPQPLE